MDKKLTIYDYAKRPVEITIPDFEEVNSAYCEVISGDEILHIIYNDEYEEVFDACEGGRSIGYYDGRVDIPLDKLDEISTINDSYDMLEHFGDEGAKLRIAFEAAQDLIELSSGKELYKA